MGAILTSLERINYGIHGDVRGNKRKITQILMIYLF